MRGVALRQHGFDDEQFAIGRDRLAAIPQNFERLFVGPIVQDMREQVGVIAARH